MATKAPKVVVLKGQEAEDKVLEYMKRMNRPYGAVDVSANLKGAIPKAATQKILLSLAEKGEILQKTYGKSTFFVANQDRIEAMPAEQVAALQAEIQTLDKENKDLAAKVRVAAADLAKLRLTPTDSELDEQISHTQTAITTTEARLEPLRTGEPVVSAEDMSKLDGEWNKWRTEWVRRRKIFNTFWEVATDAFGGKEVSVLAEELGIEMDSEEHERVEKSELCVGKRANLKRKRDREER